MLSYRIKSLSSSICAQAAQHIGFIFKLESSQNKKVKKKTF